MSHSRFEWIELEPPVDVLEADYVRLLGYPGSYVLEGRSRELADWAINWFAQNGRPWIYARSADAVEITENKVRIDRTQFSSGRLRSQFAAAEATGAVLVAISAGAECEAEAGQRWRDEKPDEYFFLETYGSAVVESLVARAAGKICNWADQAEMSALPHCSPGYAGWRVSEQMPLWELLRGNDSSNVCNRLRVMDSGMLQPKKSLLAVFGLTRHRDRVQPGSALVPCVNCVLADCQFRRAPHRHFNRQSKTFSKTSNSL